MKNIVQTTLLALALLGPTTGFAMEPAAPVEASATWTGSECICLGAETSDDRITLECHSSHTFHRKCLTPWLQIHNTCPSCNRQVTATHRTALGLDGIVVPAAIVAPAAIEPNIIVLREVMLLDACADENLVRAAALLDAGVHPDATNAQGATSLHIACINGYLAIIALLLERGANIESRDIIGKTPLMEACEYGGLETARRLLRRGADVDRASNHGITALTYACHWGHYEVLQLLLDHGATTTWAQWRTIQRWRIRRNKGKIAAGACTLAAAGLAYWYKTADQE